MCAVPCLLQEQSIELIDHISSFVDSPKDSLAFLLMSKHICNVVIPNHIKCWHSRSGFNVSIEIVDED